MRVPSGDGARRAERVTSWRATPRVGSGDRKVKGGVVLGGETRGVMETAMAQSGDDRLAARALLGRCRDDAKWRAERLPRPHRRGKYWRWMSNLVDEIFGDERSCT